MSGRYRTVGLQAVGVAVLAAFVFIAFLRPSEPNELSRIDAPSGGDDSSIVANPPDDDDDKKGDKKNSKSQNQANANNGRSNGPGANGNDRGIVPARSDDVVDPPDGDDGPDDYQYTDLVSLLMKRVGEPKLFREIDQP